jgi:hypothetical protein
MQGLHGWLERVWSVYSRRARRPRGRREFFLTGSWAGAGRGGAESISSVRFVVESQLFWFSTPVLPVNVWFSSGFLTPKSGSHNFDLVNDTPQNWAEAILV